MGIPAQFVEYILVSPSNTSELVVSKDNSLAFPFWILVRRLLDSV